MGTLEYVYVLVDNDDNSLQYIFDFETLKKRYKEFVIDPPHYSNKDYWSYYNVYKCKLNSDDIEYIEPEYFKETNE